MRRVRLFHEAERIPRGGYWIHLMRPSEFDQVIDLESRSFDQPWSAELVSKEVGQEHSVILVISNHEAVVGFVILWVVFDEIHILNIAVDPTLRRRGIARLLLEELLERGKQAGLATATLEVRVGNVAARGLYESLGFKTIGLRKGYYADGEDAQVMQKVLGPEA